MPCYRITKYDPTRRNASGAFTGDDWTSFSDIGRVFGGVVLRREDYLQVESAYIDTALAFLDEDRAPDLRVVALEVRGNGLSVPVDGASVQKENLAEVCRSILREKFWCRLEGDGRYLHFGWDFYMYVGVLSACAHARDKAHSRGLFVEVFESPYAEDKTA